MCVFWAQSARSYVSTICKSRSTQTGCDVHYRKTNIKKKNKSNQQHLLQHLYEGGSSYLVRNEDKNKYILVLILQRFFFKTKNNNSNSNVFAICHSFRKYDFSICLKHKVFSSITSSFELKCNNNS